MRGIFVQNGHLFGAWWWRLPMIEWFFKASDRLSVWDEPWCYLYPFFPTPANISLSCLYEALQWRRQFSAGLQPTGVPLHLSNQHLLCTKAAQTYLSVEVAKAFLTPFLLLWWQMTYKYSTCVYKTHPGTNTEWMHDSLLSSPSTGKKKKKKLCTRETNCCAALALQWRMKVHWARQTSIPLQPPLSNKHIYYSGWAKLEVSLHTPPTSYYSGQWDSRHFMLGISTRRRKKKWNKWHNRFLLLQRNQGPKKVFTH